MNHTKFTTSLYKRLKAHSGTIFRVLFLTLVAASVTAIMIVDIDSLPSNVQVGKIALHDIRAEQNYELVDVRSTAKLRKEAADAVLPVYDFDAGLVVYRVQKIRESFAEARKKLEEAKNLGLKELSADEEARLRQNLQIALGLALTDSHYALLRRDGFSEDLEQALTVFLEPIQKRPILEDKTEFLLRGDRGIVLRTIMEGVSEIIEVSLFDYDSVLSRKEAEETYAEASPADIQKQSHFDFLDISEIRAAQELLPEFIKSNVVFNKAETDLRKERAQSSIQNITIKLQKGQNIIRRGDRYEPRHLSDIEGMRSARLRTNSVLEFTGLFSLIAAAITVLYSFASHHIRKFKPATKDIYFLGLMLVGFVAFLRMTSFMATGLKDGLWFVNDLSTLYYLIPVAAGAMMVRYILNSETALLFAVLLSFLSGIFLENDLEISFYYLISGVVAAHFIGHVERRSSVFRCGIYIGLVNAGLVIALELISRIAASAAVDLESLSINCLFAFGGGLLAAIVMLAFSPVIETLFNYTTNIQLLELANMNHPLLREMIVRAPGTYHHSQLVGILAEAGARATGANPLLTRVGSYYHDIGKMKKPHYFVENQKGDNPHDRLSPHMSALIIEAHVADGIEMALEHKLPKLITDFIPEHQGTKLIGYFFNKAKKMADTSHTRVEEKDFRYKGPRPQSREAGIVMLADTIEAAVRSMPEKTPQKIQGQVEKLVNAHFVDGQLNECDLTLRDLHHIALAFVKILIGIYHQRVEYPEEKHKSPIKIVKDSQHESVSHSHLQLSQAPDNIAPLFKEKH